MNSKVWAASLSAVIVSFAANAAQVTPTNLQGWKAANQTGGATAKITGTYTPPGAGQNGSLQFSSPSNTGKADFVYSFAGQGITLGDIANGAISFDYYRSSTSTARTNLLPALRLSFTNAAGKTGYLIWEGVYNGEGTIATDSWHTATLTGDYFYQRTASVPGGSTTEVPVYNRTLADYLSGSVYTGSGKSTYALGAGTIINSLEIGVGSGWGGSFYGAVDNVSVSLGTKGTLAANFQVAASSPTPEPATWAMMVGGFGLIGGAMRRRQRTNASFA